MIMPSRVGKSKTAAARKGLLEPLDAVAVGANLRQARASMGRTQSELARKTGIHITELSKIEGGLRLPTLPQAMQLVRELRVPLQWLVTGTYQPGESVADIAIELQHYGVVDLIVQDPVVPGSFRRPEELVALALKTSQPSPRLVEAMPAVLAWNEWSVDALEMFAALHDDRALQRIAWLADVALSIERHSGFPGGCPSRRSMERLLQRAPPPEKVDDLGVPGGDVRPSPAARRWKINYPATLETFRVRARELHVLRTGHATTRTSASS